MGGFSALLLAVLFSVPSTLLTTLYKQVVGFFVALVALVALILEVFELVFTWAKPFSM